MAGGATTKNLHARARENIFQPVLSKCVDNLCATLAPHDNKVILNALMIYIAPAAARFTFLQTPKCVFFTLLPS